MKQHECPLCGEITNILYGNMVACRCGHMGPLNPPTRIDPQVTPTGRNERYNEERWLRERLRDLHHEFRERAEPLTRRLAEIEAAKPIIHTLDLSTVEERVLAQLNIKIDEGETHGPES